MEIPTVGQRVRLEGLVTAVYGQAHMDPTMCSVTVQLPDGQGVQTNVRNFEILADDSPSEETPVEESAVVQEPDQAEPVTEEAEPVVEQVEPVAETAAEDTPAAEDPLPPTKTK